MLSKGCNAVTSITDAVHSWPDLVSISDTLDLVYKVLEPILKFMELLQEALEKEVCFTDPIEAGKEVFGRKRRSLKYKGKVDAHLPKRKVIRIELKDANNILKSSISKRAAETCFRSENQQ